MMVHQPYDTHMPDPPLMHPIRVTRSVRPPDLVRLSRYQKSPKLGPRVLFF